MAVELAHAITPHTQLERTRYGGMLIPTGDMFIGRSLQLYGEYTQAECTLLRRAIPQDGVVLDIGANIGSHTLAFADAAPSGRVIALEPQPRLFDLLCANLTINKRTQVEALRVAAGARADICRIADIDLGRPANLGLYRLSDTPDGTPTPVITIDSLHLARIDVMKCDVEGMETEVLLGAKATLARCRPLLYMENDRVDRSVELAATLLAAGYRLWWHTPLYFNPDNWRGLDVNHFGDIRSLNLLAVPAERAAAYTDLTRGLVELRRAESAWPPIILA